MMPMIREPHALWQWQIASRLLRLKQVSQLPLQALNAYPHLPDV